MHFEKRILTMLISAILVLTISPLFAQEFTWTRQALGSNNVASARAVLALDSIEVKVGETAEVRVTYTSDPTFGTSVISGIISCQRAVCQVVGAIIGADGERVTLRDTTGINPTQQYVWIEASFKPDRRQSSQTREPARLSVRGVGVGQSNLVWQTVRLSFSAPFPTPPFSLTTEDGFVKVTVTEPPPVADFTGSPTSGVKPLTVQFTDASTGQITSRSWNFGDGQTSTETSPSHTYVNAGTYTVSLTVTGPGGSNTKTRTNYITVQQPALNPPQNLTAQSGPGASVRLSWQPPATSTADTAELAYDDGTSEALIRGNFSGAEFAVRFSSSSPLSLIALGFLSRGDQNNDVYGVKVYLDPTASNAGPAGSPAFTGNVSFSTPGTVFASFPTSISIPSGDFYIALNYISGTTKDFGIGLDSSSDSLRSWLRTSSGFKLARDVSSNFAGNFVIRAVVVRSASGGSMIASSGMSTVERQGTVEGFSNGRNENDINNIQIIRKLNETSSALFANGGYALFPSESSHYNTAVYLTSDHRVFSPTGLQSYNIYRSTASPVQVTAPNKIGNVNVDVTRFDDVNVIGGTTYYYVVTAVYDEGESNPSNEASAQVSPPAAPLLASPANGSTGISINPTLSWNATGGAISYRLQVSLSSAFLTTVVDQSGITTTSFVVSGLANNTTYYWRVHATNAGGTSDWSSTWNFTTIIDPSSAPTLISPANGAMGQPITLTFSWNPVAGTVTYRLQVSRNSAFTTTVVDDSALTSTSSQVGPLANNTTYYWRVKAKNALGSSAWSSPVWSYITIIAMPTLVSPSNGAVEQPTTLTLSWNPVAGAITYGLQVSASIDFTTPIIDDATITTTSRQVGALAENTTYYWHVNATNAGGTSSYSELWHFTTNTTSVQAGRDIPHEFSLSQNYPNPFNPSTTVEYTLPKSAHVELKVYNVRGNEIQTLVNGKQNAGLYRVSFDSQGLPSGLYFYRLHAGEFVAMKKMVVTK